MAVRIVNNPDDVMPFCDDIAALADTQSAALGFHPKRTYAKAILRGAIHVAVMKEQDGELFAGHIWLGGRRPTQKIYQVAVCPDYHGRGIGGKLLTSAINHAKSNGFRALSAKVGAQLPAKHFWKKKGFNLVDTVPGKSAHPVCDIWQKDLMPNLLTPSASASGANDAIIMKHAIESVKTEFSVVLDTNIFIRAGKGSQASLSILNREERGQINILCTSTTIKELKKYKGNDGALKSALHFPQLTASADGAVVEKLRKIIFSSKALIKEQDKSDLESLAVAIAASVPIFVTEDKEILLNAREIYKEFSMEIRHPCDLWDEMLFGEEGKEIEEKTTVTTTGDGFRLVMYPNNVMLKSAGFAGAIVKKRESPCVALRHGKDVLGVISLEPQTEPHTRKVSLYVKPGDNDEYAADTLLGWLRREIIRVRRKNTDMFLRVELTPRKGIGAARSALLSHGYTAAPPEIIFRKMYASRAVIRENWKNFRSDLSRLLGIQLSVNIPDFCRYNQPVQISPDDNVLLNKLEDYLSSIFILPGRAGVVMPIKKWFAEDFFGHSGQSRLFSASAELLGHKSYLGTTKSQSRLQVGMPLFFYQSKAKNEPGQIVAVARIVRTQIVDTGKISSAKKRHLVLTSGDIKRLKNPVLETVFDNCVILPSPVTLDKLREMKCDHPAGFVTATSIEYEQMHKILKKGLSA